MSNTQQNQAGDADILDPRWKDLYRFGGIAVIGTLFWLPGIGVMFLFLTMLGSIPWNILLARAFFHLAKEQS